MNTPSTQEQFKSGMQLLAATVTLITSAAGGLRSGLAATAVTSLSTDPPSLLICVNRTSRTYGFIRESGRFAVNLVPDTLPELVDAFASKGDLEAQFRAAGSWDTCSSGMPVLKESVAWFSCRVSQENDAGSHVVIFGQVEDLHLRPEASPIVYARRAYHHIEPIHG